MAPSVNSLNVVPGTIYHMDNLLALRGMNSSIVDLIATDPPFNKEKNREAAGGKYVDQWRWDVNVHRHWMDDILDSDAVPRGRAIVKVIEAAQVSHSENMGAFLCFLGVRLLEMKRILKPTGSIYVHMDATASHYVKALMDAVFGRKNFRNEIVWSYSGGGVPKKDFARKHDTILRYRKTGAYLFNPQYRPYSPTCSGRHSDGTPVDTERGAHLTSVWGDISPVNTQAKNRTGYPDQKPVPLYERIVAASSNEGDLVLDPFCGCGTTLLAARNLKRKFIGIDRNDDAKEMMLCNFAGMKKSQT